MKSAALRWLCFTLLSCGHRDEGLTATVTARTVPPLGDVFLSNQAVQVTAAQLQVAFVTLKPCPSSPLAQWLHALSPIGTAHAHDKDAALRSKEPASLDLLSPWPQRAGLVHPPPGRYCGIHMLVGPTPHDTRSLWLSVGMETSEVRTLSFPLEAFELDADHRNAEIALTLHPNAWFDGVDLRGAEAGFEVLNRMALSP